MTALCRLALAFVLLAPAAFAADPPMQVIETRPAARSVMDGNRQEIFVRFSGPVDHHASRLALLQGDRLVRQLEPRLTASPDTLYAIAGGLAPGAFVLRWEAKSRRDGRMSEGHLDFTVR